MADMRIEDAARVSSVGGTEIVPVSIGGAAKSATSEQIKDYVITAIEALTSASAADVANDGVYIKKDGHIKPLSMNTLCDAVYANLFDKTSAGTLVGSEIISVEKSGSAKTTTVSALCSYVASQIPAVDIHALSDAGALTDNDFVAVSQQSGSTSVWNTLKSTLSTLAAYVIGKIASVAESTSAIASGDYMLVLTGNPLSLKKVTRANAVFASGDVTGPNDAVANQIPQWNANGSKQLKAGLSVSTTISGSSQNSEIPTAASVRSYVTQFGFVSTSDTTTETKVPQWGATSGTLNDGLSIQTSVRATGTAADTAIATEKAVRDALSTKVTVGTAASAGKILVWGPGGTATTNVERASTITSSATDDTVPTTKAVYDFVMAQIAAHVSEYHTSSENA